MMMSKPPKIFLAEIETVYSMNRNYVNADIISPDCLIRNKYCSSQRSKLLIFMKIGIHSLLNK